MQLVVTQLLIGLVALIQIVIAISEIFLWKKIYKRLEPEIVFQEPKEAYKITPIVQNAGLYNGFLAAGLIWGLIAQTNALEIQSFFLACVLLAGIFGAMTLKRTTLVIQAIPSLTALLAIWYGYSLT